MAFVGVEQEGLVGVVELRRPPHNFFDAGLIGEIGSAFEALDADPGCRAIVLAAEGRSFCAGADFSGQRPDAGSSSSEGIDAGSLYHEALRLFAIATPVVAAVHGAAIGGGLGLALVADFRVDLSGCSLVGQLRSARLPPRVRPDGHAARSGG